MKTNTNYLIVLFSVLLFSCDYMGDEFVIKERIVTQVDTVYVTKADTVYVNKCKVDSLWEGGYTLDKVIKGDAPAIFEVSKSSDTFYTLFNSELSIDMEYKNVLLLQGYSECESSGGDYAYIYRDLGGGSFTIDVQYHPEKCAGFSAVYRKK